MKTKAIIALGAVCALLLLIIIGELVYARFTEQALLNTHAAADKKPTSSEIPSLDLTKQSEDSFDDMVTRPLFVEGRKPVPETAATQTQASTVNVKFDWQLDGVFTAHKQLVALVARTTTKVPKDNFRKLKVGDDLDGWKITELTKEKMQLTQEGIEKTLELRKPKPKQLAQKKANLPRANRPRQPGEEALQEGRPEGAEPPDAPIPTPEIEQEFDPESADESFENNDNEQF